jgi:hypothetical protein
MSYFSEKGGAARDGRAHNQPAGGGYPIMVDVALTPAKIVTSIVCNLQKRPRA